MQLRVRQFGATLLLQDSANALAPLLLASVIAAVVCLPATAWAAVTSGAAVTGIVRDVQGVAQPGALVQVMTAGLDTPRTAFTDSHGRYSIVNLLPGRYAVQASAALFISSTKDNLQLRPGRWAVVNLTLATLFDASAWLPAERRKTDEPGDDWKWTLRSSASRPMLRMVDDGTPNGTSAPADRSVLVSSSATEGRRELSRTREDVSSGDGEFGHGGTHNILAQNRELMDGSDLILRMDVGLPSVPIGVGPSTEVDTGFGRQLGFAGAVRTVLSYQNHPEIISSGGDLGPALGLAAMQMASAEQLALGDSIKVEFGSQVYAVRTLRTVAAAEPFVRIAIQPGAQSGTQSGAQSGAQSGVWTIGYRMATARNLQSFADLDAVERDLPVAVAQGNSVRPNSVRLEHGNHQEISISRKAWRGVAQVALYRDRMDRPAIGGGGILTAGATAGNSGVLEDPSTSSFRFLGPAYQANGVNLLLSEPLSKGLWAAVEYSTGSALSGRAVTDGMSLADAASTLQRISGQSATFAIKGRLIRTGTRLRAAYRWQPTGLVTAVDPYRAFSDQAYLSFAVRQPIHAGRLLPPGLEGIVNVTNLLAQGYRPFLSPDGGTLFLAQAPRAVEVGLSVTF